MAYIIPKLESIETTYYYSNLIALYRQSKLLAIVVDEYRRKDDVKM